MPAVTTMNASGPATPGLTPQPTSAAEKGLLSVSAPNADAERVARVTPIWTVARNRLGSARGLPRAAPRRPCSDRVRTWDSRNEISASSVPEKKPPIRTKTTTMTMLSQTSLTGGVLLGVVGWGGHLHGARSVRDGGARGAVEGRSSPAASRPRAGGDFSPMADSDL